MHLHGMQQDQLAEKISGFLVHGITTDQRYEQVPELVQEIDAYRRNQGPAYAHLFGEQKQQLITLSQHYFLSKQHTSITTDPEWLKQLSIGCLEKIVSSIATVRASEKNEQLYEQLRFLASQEYKSRLTAHKYK